MFRFQNQNCGPRRCPIKDQGSRIKDQGSRIKWSSENFLDLKKKSLQRRSNFVFSLKDGLQRRSCRVSLVEKFDTELFSDFSAKSSNFRRLVLSCINADFCVQILILQRFSRSTRFSHLCTARHSKSSQIFIKLFHIFAEIYVKIAIFSAIVIEFCTHFNENFSEFL